MTDKRPTSDMSSTPETPPPATGSSTARAAYLPIGVSLGLSIGIVFGLLIFDNIGLGIGIGLAIGAGLGAALSLSGRAASDGDHADDPSNPSATDRG